jgi:protein-L-isoaspartate(D-aspartate) O-methyltransferase
MIVTSMAPVDCTRDEQSSDPFLRRRTAMVADQIAARGVKDPRVLEAMRSVPRHEFVPAAARPDAYEDTPLPIGFDQTISQPYIVALMTELARPAPTDRVLEVGTGSGYQAAVLSGLVSRVFSIELVEPLARSAAATLQRLGYANVAVRSGDGYNGWPDEAPFDIILVTAAPEDVPPALLAQLRPGGRLVIPVGPIRDVQDLRMIEKDDAGRITARSVIPVRFVPMIRKRGG